MLTDLLNDFLIKKLNMIPFTTLCPVGSARVDAYCSDGSCFGNCAGSCQGDPRGVRNGSSCSDGSCFGNCAGTCHGDPRGW